MAVTLTLYNPVIVVVEVETVNTELHEQPAVRLPDAGLNERVRPDGLLTAVKLMVPEKPFKLLTTVLKVPDDPLGTAMSPGLDATEKSPVVMGLIVPRPGARAGSRETVTPVAWLTAGMAMISMISVIATSCMVRVVFNSIFLTLLFVGYLCHRALPWRSAQETR